MPNQWSLTKNGISPKASTFKKTDDGNAVSFDVQLNDNTIKKAYSWQVRGNTWVNILKDNHNIKQNIKPASPNLTAFIFSNTPGNTQVAEANLSLQDLSIS